MKVLLVFTPTRSLKCGLQTAQREGRGIMGLPAQVSGLLVQVSPAEPFGPLLEQPIEKTLSGLVQWRMGRARQVKARLLHKRRDTWMDPPGKGISLGAAFPDQGG
jgi:hypothetical protein